MVPKRNYSTGRDGTSVLNATNPWRAQIRYRDTEIYLGAFPTWEAAFAAENSFRQRKGLPAYNPRLVRV